MPELPEVEAARALLATHCVGKQVLRVHVLEQGGGARTGLFDDVVLSDRVALRALAGRRVDAVGRHGKQLWLTLGDKDVLFHCGMTGSFVVQGVKPAQYKEFKVDDAWPPRFTKLELELAGARVAFADPRRLGRVFVGSARAVCATLAPDPLTTAFVQERFVLGVRRRSAPVKAVLLDQHALVAGVGNWVADEALFQAGLRPEVLGRSCSVAMAEALYDAIVHVCSEAARATEAHGGELNKFPSHWLFHARWGLGPNGRGRLPDGRAIKTLVVGGRTTAVVPAAQRPKWTKAACRLPRAAPLRPPAFLAAKAAHEPKAGRKRAVPAKAGRKRAAAPPATRKKAKREP